MFEQVYNDMKEGYKESWFRPFFEYTALGKLLEQDTKHSFSTFLDTYISSWWWNRLWFRACVQNNDYLARFDRILNSAGVCLLKGYGILTEENRALVANHDHPDELLRWLVTLGINGILTQDNFTLLTNHPDQAGLTSMFRPFQRAGILTQDNFTLIANHANTSYLANALAYLQIALILTEANFRALVAPNHAALVSAEAVAWVWSSIPRDLLTQANFESLLTASEHANPIPELIRIVNQILGIQAQAGHAAAFNPVQSTHTASVHRSTSESALRLMKSYEDDLNLDTKIEDIKADMMGLDHSFKNQAAQRCIARITGADDTFTDSSGVSTRQLLAWAYTAIHDGAKRQGTLEDAKALFVDGLYEIQRGYNLNEQGIDNQSPFDRPICAAGTFNKLMEKLNGIHPDVEVYFITHEGAYIKFSTVVAAHALNYLNRLVNPETATDYLSIKARLDSMKDNGLADIWDEIKSAVEETLWDEFKEAYTNNQAHDQFRAMIDSGHESNAPNLTELYCQLEASPGYQAFLYPLEQSSLEEQKPFLRLHHQHSLWANRSSSTAAQNAFDRKYCLVPVNIVGEKYRPL